MGITKIQILEKEHSLISDMAKYIWESVTEKDKEDDRLALAYISGVSELASHLIDLLDKTETVEG